MENFYAGPALKPKQSLIPDDCTFGNIEVDLGRPTGKPTKSWVNFEVNIGDLKNTSHSSNRPSETTGRQPEEFLGYLKLQAKPGRANDLKRVLDKLIDPRKRFKPIPQVFYYIIAQKQLEVEIKADTLTDVVVVYLKPKAELSAVLKDLYSTLLLTGLSKAAKEGFKLEATLDSSENFLEKVVNFAVCEDEFFFPHLLNNSAFSMKYSNVLVETLDCFGMLPQSANINLTNIDLNPPACHPWLQMVEDAYRWTVRSCKAATESLMKQVCKLRLGLQSRMEEAIVLGLSIKEIGRIEIQVQGQGLLEFMEFMVLHPSHAISKEGLGDFYDVWLKKVGHYPF